MESSRELNKRSTDAKVYPARNLTESECIILTRVLTDWVRGANFTIRRDADLSRLKRRGAVKFVETSAF